MVKVIPLPDTIKNRFYLILTDIKFQSDELDNLEEYLAIVRQIIINTA